MDAIHCAGLRRTPAENSLDEYIIDFLLPKLQSQPGLYPIRQLLFKGFPEALLEVGRVMTLSFWKRMKRPKTCLGQLFSAVGVFKAIQQHES
jgi:hypothetical protein